MSGFRDLIRIPPRTAIPVLAAVVLLVCYAVAEGLWTNRWKPSRELQAAVARLERVPRTVGDWKGQDLQLDPRQVEAAELKGYVSRKYVHAKTGEVVSILLVCGPAGPVSVHPPDICYRGAGFEPAAKPVKRTVGDASGGPPGEFLTALFRKQAPVPEALRIYWGWSATGPSWQAPANPRFKFARYRALYKLYVIHPLAGPVEQADKDPCHEFMAVLLPGLRESLFNLPPES